MDDPLSGKSERVPQRPDLLNIPNLIREMAASDPRSRCPVSANYQIILEMCKRARPQALGDVVGTSFRSIASIGSEPAIDHQDQALQAHLK
jgi:hypothetical protein